MDTLRKELAQNLGQLKSDLRTQVFPWTEAELAQRLADNDPFAREILGTGQPLAGSSKWP